MDSNAQMSTNSKWVIKLSSIHIITWIWFIAAVVIGFCCSFAVVWVIMTRPPIVVTNMHELDGSAVSGGHLDIVAKKVENQSCMSAVARFLYRDDPLVPGGVEFQALTGAPYAAPVIENKTSRIVVPVPDAIEPGSWHYYAQALDTCNSVMSSPVRTSPDLVVEIRPGAKSVDVPSDTLPYVIVPMPQTNTSP